MIGPWDRGAGLVVEVVVAVAAAAVGEQALELGQLGGIEPVRGAGRLDHVAWTQLPLRRELLELIEVLRGELSVSLCDKPAGHSGLSWDRNVVV